MWLEQITFYDNYKNELGYVEIHNPYDPKILPFQYIDFVFACVGNDDDLRSVIFGDNGVLAGMKAGAVLVDHTTTSAIVARELNIPAVVGVDGACNWLEDGDWVELDGGSGTIRKLGEAEQAA